jgi:hypothetical protein
MSWRPHGHVRVNARSPNAAGICDRCGFAYNHNRLQWQWEWSGNRLINLRLLVCDRCLDVPQEQLRARVLTPDPVPIYNARPEPFAPTGVSPDETDYLTLIGGSHLATISGLTILRVNDPLGS